MLHSHCEVMALIHRRRRDTMRHSSSLNSDPRVGNSGMFALASHPSGPS